MKLPFRRAGLLAVLLLGILVGCAARDTGRPNAPRPEESTREREENPRAAPLPLPATDKSSNRRHALLVGCTRYDCLPPALSNLEGPGNDVVLLRKVLQERFHFPEENITVLSESAGDDNRPTLAHIRREFDRLLHRIRSGDQVVILLSGHGSQQPDQPPLDEADGLDELFLPADARPPRDGEEVWSNVLADDELGERTQQLIDRGVHVWLIADSCHSGTLLRGGGEVGARSRPRR